MKKIIIILLICFILTGCSIPGRTNKTYSNVYGKYMIPSNWEFNRNHSTTKKYFFVNKKDRNNNLPNNISVEYGTNKYSKDNHMMFRQAILSQLLAQSKRYNTTIKGDESYTKQGYILYTFVMESENSKTVQYYIVGDYKYILVHETVFDNNKEDADNAAKYIVDSFVWRK